MTKTQLLEAITFGERVAEQEEEELHSYFVETAYWQNVFSGNKDIVYGAKGSGKSAIYSLLLGRKEELLKREIIVIAAENPRGLPVFKDLVADPPTKENEFRNLWKLYFLVLVAEAFRDQEITARPAKKVIEQLEDAQLLPKEFSLSRTLSNVRIFVSNLTRLESIEAGGELDNITNVPKVHGKIRFREPGVPEQKLGFISTNKLLELANDALQETGWKVWIALDRLDAAFDDSEVLENNALRALFRVYLDISRYKNISLKIFLRSDIWQRLAGQQRLPEASHITRTTTINWDSQSLLKLIIRRALYNDDLRQFYQVNDPAIWRDPLKQEELFYRIFPLAIDEDKAQKTLEWMQYWTRDGSGLTTPRELIHLLSEAREIQLQKLLDGEKEPSGERLFEPDAFKEALPAVSRIRYNQTFCAEFPKLADLAVWLEGKNPQQTAETLAEVWGNNEDQALAFANELFEAGFFERQGSRERPVFIVPRLYRYALKMIQETPKVSERTAVTVPPEITNLLQSGDPGKRAAALIDLARLGDDDSFREIILAFDDPVVEVRNAAAHALFERSIRVSDDRAGLLTRALRESPSERRRKIGAALASSGLASEAIGHLVGENREETYDAFSLLFLMSKGGEVQPLMHALEEHPNNEVRIAIVKLLALSGQQEVLPAFRRLAVRGSLPTEVRSAVMEAIYQISSKTPSTT